VAIKPKYMMKKIPLFGLLALLLACTEEQPEIQQMKLENTQVLMSPLQLSNLKIQPKKAQLSSLKDRVYLNGVVTALPNYESIMSAVLPARVMKIFVQEGQEVKKGNLLIKLESMDFIDLQAEYLQSIEEAKLLLSVYERQKTMSSKNVGALSDLQLAEAKYKAMKNKTKSLRAKLELLGADLSQLDGENPNIVKEMQVLAPIDGYVQNLVITIGESLEKDKAMLKIVNTSELQAELYIYEKDIHTIALGQEVELSFSNEKIPNLTGKVFNMEHSFDPTTRSVAAHVRFFVPKDIQNLVAVNMKVQAILSHSDGGEELDFSVPQSALLEEEGLFYIYATEDNPETAQELVFTKYKVQLKDKDEKSAEIVLQGSPKVLSSLFIADNNVLMLEAERKKRVGI
jgi:membrane fusion protein, heavy metal efflux system